MPVEDYNEVINVSIKIKFVAYLYQPWIGDYSGLLDEAKGLQQESRKMKKIIKTVSHLSFKMIYSLRRCLHSTKYFNDIVRIFRIFICCDNIFLSF